MSDTSEPTKINGGFYIYDVVKNGNAKSTKIVGIVVFKTHIVKDKNNSDIEETQMLKLDMDMNNIEVFKKIQNFRDTDTKVDGKEIFLYSPTTLQQIIGKSFDPELSMELLQPSVDESIDESSTSSS